MTEATGLDGDVEDQPQGAYPLSPPFAPQADASAEAEEVILAPPLANVIGYLLRRAHNAFQAYWMMSFRESETPITPVQGGMLVVLADNPGLTQTALARMMNVEGPTLMQSVDRLEHHGYVQRTRRPGDRRSYALQLTPRGQEVLRAIQQFLPARDRELLGALTREEADQLAALLTKIITRAHTRMKQAEAAAEGEPEAAPARQGRSRAG